MRTRMARSFPGLYESGSILVSGRGEGRRAVGRLFATFLVVCFADFRLAMGSSLSRVWAALVSQA